MEKRNLDLRTLEQVKEEVDRLHQSGYVAVGNWNLGQTCDHLAYFIEGHLDGPKFRVPWIVRVLIGRWYLNRILKSRKMGDNSPTPQKPLPEPDTDERAAVERLKTAIDRLLAAKPENLHGSPAFGKMTAEEIRELHVIHCQHHLNCLRERPGAERETQPA